uniref:Putative DNA translocase n=1 Tax=viral metagenome TaxID=1070528 RepID=A0A6M3L4H7_9ZZZZ
MQRNLTAHAKVYAHLLATLFAAQHIGGKLAQVSRGPRFLSLSARLNDPRQIGRALKLSEPLALASKTENVIAQRDAGYVSYQIELQQSYWQWYTRADLPDRAAVGLGVNRSPVTFGFDDDPHSLFAGATNSGKTEALKSALVAAIGQYTPDDLKLVLVDTNGELSDFMNAANLALPIASEPNDVENAIRFVAAELVRRKTNNTKGAPRLVLAIDEVDDLPDADQLRLIAKQGRKYRINLMIGTQRASQKTLPSILDNLTGRYVGRVDNAQASAMMTGHSGMSAHQLTGKGDFLSVLPGGRAVRFQVALATQADFNTLPRAEVAPVIIEPAPVIDLPDDDTTTGGRPELTIEYNTLGRYLAHHSLNQALSISRADAIFGHKRTLHTRYCNALAELITGYKSELKRIREEQ